MSQINYKNIKFIPLSEANLASVHNMCEKNVRYSSQSFKTFEKATLKSKHFIPDLSIIALDQSDNVIAFFMIVFRRSIIWKKRRKVAVLKFFVVHKDWRLKGLGSKIFSILEKRVKKSDQKNFWMKFEVMTSMPNYWYPGLNPKHTEAFFFLKKHGFKKVDERVNLCLDLEELANEPPNDQIDKYKISRATLDDKKELLLLEFMPRRYRLIFWSEEINLSFQEKPITTFIAKNLKTDKIVGWASHSVQFPGSFGPTGVYKKARGKGLGTLLLNWCLWDIKKFQDVKKAKIIWVVGETIYFYLRSFGAKICEIYWPMSKRI